MKKTAMIFSCALLAFACVFARENRAAGQRKVAGARAKEGRRRRRRLGRRRQLPQIDKEKIRARVKYLSSDEWKGGEQGSAVAIERRIISGNSLRRMV